MPSFTQKTSQLQFGLGTLVFVVAVFAVVFALPRWIGCAAIWVYASTAGAMVGLSLRRTRIGGAIGGITFALFFSDTDFGLLFLCYLAGLLVGLLAEKLGEVWNQIRQKT